jgi:hypothetical protein
MTPSPELKARILAATIEDPAPDRRAVRRRTALSWMAATVFTLLVFGAVGGLRAVERPLPFVLATAGGWAVIAMAVSWACSRKGSMVGRPLEVLLPAILATPLALGAWYLVWLERGPSTDLSVPAAAPLGRAFVCLGVSLVFAAAPFLVIAGRLRATAPAHPRVTLAAMAVVAGTWACVLMDLHCEHVDLAHVTVGHILPVLVMALVGFLLGERLLGVHAEVSAGRPRAIRPP